jgi:serine-type D-Ala-D-Ala carboxypeptidase/endopeptidase (penicillin-binding protein 4)
VLSLLLAATLTDALDEILNRPILQGATVGVHVTDLSGESLYSRNPDLRVVPASNQKLLSCALALDTFGPDYRPTVRFWKGTVESLALALESPSGRPYRLESGQSVLVVDTDGMPMASHSELKAVAERLALPPNTHVLIRQAFRPMVPPDWEHDDLPHKYAARVTAFAVDRNSFEIWAEGGEAFFQPTSYAVRIERGQTSGTPRVDYNPFAAVAVVHGALPQERTRLDTLALPAPDLAAASLFGSTAGWISTAPTTPPSLVMEGATMAETIRECLVRSDNNIAESLLLMSTHRLTGRAPTYASARTALAEFLQKKVGAPPNHMMPRDGSGMSRHNLVTARSLTQLLLWTRRQPYGEVWQQSLPRPGQGTLASRLRGVETAAKTGTLNMVVALSGYATARDGQPLVYSVVLNHFSGSSTLARDLADEFISKLVSGDFSGTQFALMLDHGNHPSHPKHGTSDGDRLHRSRRDGPSPPVRVDRRVEPAHAAAD